MYYRANEIEICTNGDDICISQGESTVILTPGQVYQVIDLLREAAAEYEGDVGSLDSEELPRDIDLDTVVPSSSD